MLGTLLIAASLLRSSSAGAIPASNRCSDGEAISISASPDGASQPIPESFVSFSIEFSSFPDYAGNLSHPNNFTDALLENLGSFQGTKPYIRVGGNTQDFAIFSPRLPISINGTIVPALSTDYPTIITIGPSFFESYRTLPGVKFIHGFNLGKNSSSDRSALLASAPHACAALSHDNLLAWQLGNEPDLFTRSIRPLNWTEQYYVAEWRQWRQELGDAIEKACPGLTTTSDDDDDEPANGRAWYAPSFASMNFSLNPVKTWDAGLDAGEHIADFDFHNYMGGADVPGVTLAGTLMNHTNVKTVAATHLKLKAELQSSLDAVGARYILGEHNSLYRQGKPGLSNSFGAALWGVDWNLYIASKNITRSHMHMGTNYRYAAWQPVETVNTTKGTKAPYYGNVAVAATLGDLTAAEVRVAEVDLGTARPVEDQEKEAAYAVYEDDVLKRLMLVNLHQWNYTGNENQTAKRPQKTYGFTLPQECVGVGVVQRLIANGSDAITGITFNGVSYNYELDGGRPVPLGNTTKDEVVYVGRNGEVQVGVPNSSAALVQLKCEF